MKKLLIAMMLMATSATAGVVVEIGPGWMGGGFVKTYMQEVQRHESAGNFLALNQGTYSSASTLFLDRNTSCVGAKSKFRFHGPSSEASIVTLLLVGVPVPMEKKRANYIRQVMAEFYNAKTPGLGDWFLSSGAAKKWGYGFTTLRGHQVSEMFGIPTCESMGIS